MTANACRGVVVPVRSLQAATRQPLSVWVVVIRPSLCVGWNTACEEQQSES